MEQFSNTGQATLNNGGTLTTSATSFNVTSSVNVPSAGTFRALLDTEIVKVTAVSGSTWTVTRGDGGTTAATHSDGIVIYIIVTKESLDAAVTIQQAGTEISNRRILNFVSGASIADNAGSTRADITILGNTYGAGASKPAASTAGRIYIPSDGTLPQVDTGSIWKGVAICGNLIIPPALSGWTAVNQGGATFADIPGGGIYMQSTVASGDNNRMITRSASPPYTLICGFTSTVFNYGFIRIGMVVYDSVGGKLIQFGLRSGNFFASSYNSVTSFSADLFSVNYSSLSPVIWLQIADNGTTRTYSHSTDGLHWYTFFSHATNTFVTPNSAGMSVQSNNTTAPGLLTLLSWNGA